MYTALKPNPKPCPKDPSMVSPNCFIYYGSGHQQHINHSMLHSPTLASLSMHLIQAPVMQSIFHLMTNMVNHIILPNECLLKLTMEYQLVRNTLKISNPALKGSLNYISKGWSNTKSLKFGWIISKYNILLTGWKYKMIHAWQSIRELALILSIPTIYSSIKSSLWMWFVTEWFGQLEHSMYMNYKIDISNSQVNYNSTITLGIVLYSGLELSPGGDYMGLSVNKKWQHIIWWHIRLTMYTHLQQHDLLVCLNPCNSSSVLSGNFAYSECAPVHLCQVLSNAKKWASILRPHCQCQQQEH